MSVLFLRGLAANTGQNDGTHVASTQRHPTTSLVRNNGFAWSRKERRWYLWWKERQIGYLGNHRGPSTIATWPGLCVEECVVNEFEIEWYRQEERVGQERGCRWRVEGRRRNVRREEYNGEGQGV